MEMIANSIRRLWEVLFSLHLSLAIVTIVLMASGGLRMLTVHMEIRINRFLHIRQTDFIRGYFEIWIPTVLAALLILVLWRAFARTRFTHKFLRGVAGIITILCPIVFWVLFYKQNQWSLTEIFVVDPFEMVVALVCALLFLMGRWRLPLWATVPLLAAHYAFWFLANPSNINYPNYAGPLGPILGFFAATAWVLYVDKMRMATNAAT